MPDPTRPAPDGARLARIQRRFGEFATEYAALPLYSTICRHVALDAETASLLLAARPGQARPVLWLAALHDLVLRNPDLPAAQWYPSVSGASSGSVGDPWLDVRRTALTHADELRHLIATHGTQTNEVNRAVYVAVGLAAATADCNAVPVALVELGASAGLLLGVDRYAVELTSPGRTDHLGDEASPVRCSGEDRADVGAHLAAAGARLPAVRGRVGLDLDPVDLASGDEVRWLEACLWPEVPGRVERFRAACDLLRDDPPTVLRGDMVDDLAHTVRFARTRAGRDAHVVVLSSWAMTYLAPTRRLELAATLDALAGDVSRLSWLTAEPPGCVPGLQEPTVDVEGDTVLGLQRWRKGRALAPAVLGTCHPHGTWIDLLPALPHV
ncbi:DUF2332 domain-containing protein [Terrabacter sp. Soil810]|uniref:DUF2332 domain-containing protein n=1 Tax=Terrabacter sp. Soil810 TaxID=1736418 RepID=UPI00070965E0|nr:DUF2332 domain-containing protein [Terrabacter sp. Soil810]KRF41770.1 hypothetical protein ASG96_11215 [Terrabacter sp. Soil810]